MIETKTNIQNIKLVDFRLAMQAQGGKCVFSQNGTNALKKTTWQTLEKSLGRETGFKDKTQGTLFFDVADIITQHREHIMIVGFNCDIFLQNN